MTRAMMTTRLVSVREAARLFASAAKRADEAWVATAWATDRTPEAKALWAARSRRTDDLVLVVGLDFHQTDPAFLRRFQLHARVHRSADGTFHPKVYVFRKGRRFDAIVGSSNLTGAGFSRNLEANLHLAGPTSSTIFTQLVKLVSDAAEKGDHMLEADLVQYEAEYRRKQPAVREVRTFAAKSRRRVKDLPLNLTWAEYVRRLRWQCRRSGHALVRDDSDSAYVNVAEKCQGIFRRRQRLAEMDADERRQVAGLVNPYTYFGSMAGAGHFMAYVLRTPAKLDRALDMIPARGPVRIEDVDRYRRALPRHGMGSPAVGTRLLAMKRPDRFFCLTSANRRRLAKEFGFSIAELNTYEGYQRLLTRIWALPWARETRPPPRDKRIWAARVALIDAFYYDG